MIPSTIEHMNTSTIPTKPHAPSERTRDTCVRHLYIHIPFCHRRCAYCDFNTYANMEDRMEAYVDALCMELASLRPRDTRHETRDTRHEITRRKQHSLRSPVSGLQSPGLRSPV